MACSLFNDLMSLNEMPQLKLIIFIFWQARGIKWPKHGATEGCAINHRSLKSRLHPQYQNLVRWFFKFYSSYYGQPCIFKIKHAKPLMIYHFPSYVCPMSCLFGCALVVQRPVLVLKSQATDPQRWTERFCYGLGDIRQQTRYRSLCRK